jgi:Zn-dependent metalloprotease
MRMTVSSIVFVFVAWVVLAGRADDVHSARERALQYVFENRIALGLSDPTQQLREHRVIPAHKSVIFRYDQLHHGIPVYGVQLVVVVKEHGISTDSKGLSRNLTVDTKPTISSDTASVVALRAAKVTNGYRQPHPHLVILPAKTFGTVPTADVLAWSVDVYAESETEGINDLTVFVDARNGEFIAMTSHVAQTDVAAVDAAFDAVDVPQ